MSLLLEYAVGLVTEHHIRNSDMFLALPKDTISLEQMFKIKTSNNGYYKEI
jgi:hypothetical protein